MKLSEITPDTSCPCSSGALFSECCGKFITTKQHPPTAESLMRSRYTAYAIGEIEYLTRTLPLMDRKKFDRAGAKIWSEQSEWLGLEVLEVKENSPVHATVEFKAKFKIGDEEHIHHEKSRFEKQMDRWFLIDGKILNE